MYEAAFLKDVMGKVRDVKDMVGWYIANTTGCNMVVPLSFPSLCGDDDLDSLCVCNL